MPETALQRPSLILFVQPIIRGKVGEIEQRAVESGIVPVDQPQPLTCVDEICGEQVIVPEQDIDPADRALQLLGNSEEARQFVSMSTAKLLERVRVAA